MPKPSSLYAAREEDEKDTWQIRNPTATPEEHGRIAEARQGNPQALQLLRRQRSSRKHSRSPLERTNSR
jgi:hypothetical protein